MSAKPLSVKPLHIGIVAGEASGDILGAGLIKAIKARVPDVICEGVGGPLMIAEGFNSHVPMERLSVMGFVEPLKRLPELLSIRRSLRVHFTETPPDLFIGIDSPDFNVSLEESLKKHGVLTAHYVSPSVWAWRKGRIKKIARAVDIMLTLFPFEAEFYQQHKVNVCFVGHPLADTIPFTTDKHAAQLALGLQPRDDVTYVALMPGSRGSEIQHLCDVFLHAAAHCQQQKPELHFLIPSASPQRESEIQDIVLRYPALPVTVISGHSHQVMAASDAVLMASGTTTLEALLLKKPMVIAYRMAAFSYAILSRLVTSKFIGLPNLLADKYLVPEFIQEAVTPEALANALLTQLNHTEATNVLLTSFQAIHHSLRKNASATAADTLLALIQSRSLSK